MHTHSLGHSWLQCFVTQQAALATQQPIGIRRGGKRGSVGIRRRPKLENHLEEHHPSYRDKH